MVSSLIASGKCAVLVSEERDEAVVVEGDLKGQYCVVFDPLDGSSNIGQSCRSGGPASAELVCLPRPADSPCACTRRRCQHRYHLRHLQDRASSPDRLAGQQ